MPSSSRTLGAHSDPRRDSNRRASGQLQDLEDTPSPGKRPKLQHHADRPPGAENMYTFKSNVIDLTSSPPRKGGDSPQQPRPLNGFKPAAASPSTGGAKKLIVKNFKEKPKHDPEKYLSQVWAQVDSALTTIFAEDTASYSIEELYRGVENVCRQNWAAELAKRLRKRCTEHITGTVKPKLLAVASADATDVVRLVVEEWTRWRKQTAVIIPIFYYLDRSHLLRSKNDQTIDEMCIQLFRDHIFNNSALKAKVLEGSIGMLSGDRGVEGSVAFDAEVFRNVIAMYHAMAVYTSEVEPKLLGASQDFFMGWPDSDSTADDLSAFLQQSQDLKAAEIARCEKFSLPDSTRRDLISQIDTHLIERQVKRLTRASDIAKLIASNETETLASLYEWLQIKHLGESLKDPVADFIDREGTEIIFDEKKESSMVIRLLQLKRKVDMIHELSFAKNVTLGHAMRESFAEFMNKNKRDEVTGGAGNDKPGEMIAKYVDVILKGGTKAIRQTMGDSISSVPAEDDLQQQEDELDEDKVINKQLDSVLDLFRFVQGKATFEAFYKKDLAKRLLMNRSASADAEKSMIDRLRLNCGSSFTHNLEQMFKDVERSREENSTYKSLLEDRNTKQSFDLSVNTLSAAAWPSYPDAEVEIPADIQKAISAFEAHYKTKYVGRKLDWKHGLAHCQMRARFAQGPKELILSSFQAIVLLQFNDRTDNAPLSYSELQAATKLNDSELQRTLQSLACAKYKVLLKSPRGRDVNVTDRFAVNVGFHDERARIKINQIQLKETPEEQKQTHERVATDRQFETQAAIVRIMKREKKIHHPLLVVEVINALKSRGAINAEDIKKQIEKLIDKDYMERVDDNSYEYMA